jgi:Tfp pilus assembly protein PilF
MRHLNRGEPDRALEAFTQAIHLDPEFAPGYFQHAQIHQVQAQLAEATRACLSLPAPSLAMPERKQSATARRPSI